MSELRTESFPSTLAWIGEERRFWRVCTVVFGVFAVCKGLRMPLTWALTQAEIDYSHGLIKRGLLGSVYGALGLRHEIPLTVAFAVELAVLVSVLGWLAWRAGFEERFGTGAVVAVFAGSYGMTFLTQLIGYTDIPLAVLAGCLLAVRRSDVRFSLGLGLVPLAMLIHENFLLLFLPVVLFSFYLDGVLERDARGRRRVLIQGLVLAAVALGLAFALALRPNLTPAQVAQFRAEIAARVDFPVNGGVMETLRLSLLRNVRDVLVVMRQEQWWKKFLSSVCVLLVLLGVRWVRRLAGAVEAEVSGAARPTVFTAALCSCFAPLLIYALGWDCARWNVLCVLSMFLTMVLLSRRLPGRVLPFTAFDRNAVILVLAIQMASGFGFFERFQMHPYPFFPELMHTTR